MRIQTSDQALQHVFIVLRVYSKLCASSYLNLPHLISATMPFADLITPHNYVSKSNHAETHNSPKIDLLRLVQFGEVNNLIQRLRCFPICNASVEVPPQSPSPVTSASVSTPPSRASLPMLMRLNSSDNGPSLERLQASLWSLAHNELMDGVSSVDQIIFSLSSYALRTIQSRNASSTPHGHHNQHQPRGQEWTPSEFSTLPNAVVAFTAQLLAERERQEEGEEDASMLSFDFLNNTIQSWLQSCHSDDLQQDIKHLIPRLYTLWH